MTKRTREREQYLAYLLSTAIEHGGYGFSRALEWHFDDDAPAQSYAVIYDRYEEESSDSDNWTPSQTWRVDIDTMAKGLGIVRTYPSRPEGAAPWVRDLIKSDRTNGDDGDYDVLGALLVLECAIFGEMRYA